jgi:hypothetical protein
VRGWARRTTSLHDEMTAVCETDPRWWLLAGASAIAEPFAGEEAYVRSDAEPGSDTFIGYRAPVPADPYADAIARARAARDALRELDGTLPEQPLCVTVDRRQTSALVPSTLDIAAFAVGARVILGRLDDPQLAERLRRGESIVGSPFVCVSLGDDPLHVARHGHRRAWTDGGGPWLGLGRSGDLATVSTSHFAVDGYGHARITGRIAEVVSASGANGHLPALAPVDDAVPLGVAWRPLAYPIAGALHMAYALGRVLHRRAGKRDARFSPTFQIPIAPGDRGDLLRLRRRGVPAIASVRFDGGTPEPFDHFAARTREALAREARGAGLVTRLINAARAVPVPLAWKRRSVSATRPRWLDRFADVIGGRACLSRIHVDAPLPPSCAVSSPARMATPDDALGGCVITVLDDGTHASITACGSGLAGDPRDANALLDELLLVLE